MESIIKLLPRLEERTLERKYSTVNVLVHSQGIWHRVRPNLLIDPFLIQQVLFHEIIVRLRVLFNEELGMNQMIISQIHVAMVCFVAVPDSMYIC